MDAVLRAASIYLFLMVIFRLSGKRTLAQATPFDFVLLLIIGEATQQGLLGDDFSVTNALLVLTTLLAIDIGVSIVENRFPAVSRFTDGLPVVLVEDGKPIQERMHKARVAESDILEKARELQGLESLAQVKYAVLERSGGITVVPKG